MRALILLLPLAVAVAGDTSPLEQATKQWASDSAEERETASRAVAIHLQRELAPILAAMRSDDPEVRRRARAALEPLLPPRPPEPPVQEALQAAGQVVFLNNAGGAAFQGRILINGQGGMVVLQDAGEIEKLKAKGINGMPVDDPVMREQLGLADGRGFAVTAVEARSDAERLGIRANDILLSIDGRGVMQMAEVLKGLEGKAPEIRLLRRGKPVTLGAKEGEGAGGEGK